MVFCAAAVSDKCARVPSLINSLSFGDGAELERKHVVEYIFHSAAGFYVFNVQLTTSTAMKLVYLTGVVVFAIATKVL